MTQRSSSKAGNKEVAERQRKLLIAISFLLLAVLVIWYFFRGGERLVEIHGKVTHNGQPIPLKGCQIVFVQRDKGVYAATELEAEGNYRVRSYKGVGLEPGTYQVCVTFPLQFDPPISGGTQLHGRDLAKYMEGIIPKKYRDPATSELSVDLSSDPVEYNVELGD